MPFPRIPIEALPRQSFFSGRTPIRAASCPEDAWIPQGWEILTDEAPSQMLAKLHSSGLDEWVCYVKPSSVFYGGGVVELIESSRLEDEFKNRADRWENETAAHSSPTETYLHRDYYAIVGMGIANPSAIVPLILERIPNSGADWFFALEKIIGSNPAKDAADFESALEAWHRYVNKNILMSESNVVPAA